MPHKESVLTLHVYLDSNVLLKQDMNIKTIVTSAREQGNRPPPIIVPPPRGSTVNATTTPNSAPPSVERRSLQSGTPKKAKTPPAGAARPHVSSKKDTWWIDAKMREEREKYDKKFNKRLGLEDAYQKKMAKLRAQRERELIGKSFKRWKDSPKMQSGIESALLSVADKIPNPEVCSIAEDVMLLTYDLLRASSVLDYTIAVISYAKRRTVGALLHKALRGSIAAFVSSVIEEGDLSFMQSGIEEHLSNSRDTLRLWPRLKASPLWRKVNTVVVYATSLTLFGDAVNREKALRIESNFYKSRHMMQADFVYNVLDLLLFIAERGIQVVNSKKLDPMFHSGDAYEKWHDKAQDIIAKSKFLANPSAHGIDVHTFTGDLDLLIRQGQSMSKYACEIDKAAKGIIRGTVGQLLMVRATYLNRKVAQQTRKAPIAFVLEGHSSVAKTTFASILHYYYGALQKKNVEAGARYTRMSTAEFWDGFSSDQWSLLIDDAASIKPGILKDIDPSIREILQVVNNAPFSPNMASLEDKGAAPFLGELVIVTTNTPDLNLDHYFNTPGAVARRLPYHIRIRPKPAYKKNATMINESILPQLEVGTYPDWWDIEILEPKLEAMSEDPKLEFKQSFSLFPVMSNLSMVDFLRWYKETVRRHVHIQERVAIADQSLRLTGLCVSCELPSGMCSCKCAVGQPLPIRFGDIIAEYDMVPPLLSDSEDDVKDEDLPGVMQAGWEEATYFFSRQGMPDLLVSDIEVWMTWMTAVVSQIFVTWCFGGMSIWSFCILPALISLIKGHWDFFSMILWRCSNYEILAHLARGLFLKWYWMTEFMIMNKVVEPTGVVLRRCGDHVATLWFSLNRTCQLIVAVLTVALAAYGIYAYLNREEAKNMQGNLLDSVGASPLPGNETENVWKKDVYVPSTLDMGRVTLSWKNMPDDEVQRHLLKNCAFVRFRIGEQWKVAKCIALGGQYFMTTKHTIPDFEGDYIDCQLVRGPVVSGPSGNVRFKLHRDDIKSNYEKDIAIFRCYCVPPARRILDLFVREKLANFRANGYYLGRTTAGQVFKHDVKGIYETKRYNSSLDATAQVWWGQCDIVTEMGDCGAMLIARSGQGPIILGMHQLGGGGRSVGSTKVTYEDIIALIGDTLLVSDAPPLLGAEDTPLGEVKDLNPKSPLNFLEEGNVEGYGSFEGWRADLKTKVEPSIMAPFLEQHGFERTHEGPVAHGWKPKYEALKELTVLNPDVETNVVERCMHAYVDDIMKIDDKWTKELMVYDIHTAVNGVPGLRYVDGIKRNTSAGFPHCVPKQKFLEQLEPTETYPDHVVFNDEIEARVEEVLERYLSGSRGGLVFRAAFKDEALPYLKARMGKVRLFMMASVEMTIIMRMYLLSFVRVAQSNHFVFECAPGVEAQSVEWDFVFQYLTQHGYNQCIFGDFKGYDKSMHPAFVLMAFEAIAQFIERKTGDVKWANIIRCIGMDIAFALVDFFGDLVMLFGKNPSGQALTAIINGIVNSLYMRYVWAKQTDAMYGPLTRTHPLLLNERIFTLADFKEFVNLLTYGDDNGMNVSRLVPWFTHTSIQRVLETIGVIYTMADKESESVEYVSIHAGSFLKRRWRLEETTNTMVGPVEFDSISKSLMVRIPSTVVSAEIQAVDTIRGANSEFFWHGREVFEKYHSILLALVEHLQLEHNMNPPLETWELLMDRYIENSVGFLKSRPDRPDFVTTEHYRLINERLAFTMQSGFEEDTNDLPCGCTNGAMHCRTLDMEGVTLRMCDLCLFPRIDDGEACFHCGERDRCGRCGHACGPVEGGICFQCRETCYYCNLNNCARQCGNYEEEDRWDFCRHCGRCEPIHEHYRCGVCYDEGEPDQFVGDGSTSPDDSETQATRVNVTPLLIARRRLRMHAIDARVEALLPRVTMLRRRSRHPAPRSVFWSNDGNGNQQTTETTEENFQLQSGMESGSQLNTGTDVMASHSGTNETQQTAMFVDSGRGDTLEFAEANENMFTYDKQSNAELGNFLSRPRLISTITWTPGVLSDTTIDPWSAFLATPEITYKLNNYAYLRGQMRVKVVVNAANFYYGALRMYYTPLHGSAMPLSSTTGIKIQQSQRPGIWIYPQNNEGGEMVLPFIYPKNYVAITSASDVASLGRITLTAFTQLASANGATTNGVQIQVYAWMENPTLFGPTVGLAMQSGDEYGNGPISAPASAVAHWATYMSRVPIIGRLAKATGIGASAVSQMARIFGWTNVPVIDNVVPFKNVPFHDLASAHISEPTSKFTLDPKGELSVDPSVIGISSEDELSVSYLVQKESYLATGTWTAGGSTGALIFAAGVHPMLTERGTISAGGTYAVCSPPMAWVGAAFNHWRGDVIFRFKVVCSQYHSGRLRIHWDPASTLTGTTDYTHVAYTAILDIQESDEVEFRVPYMQALPWLPTLFIASAPTWSTSSVIAPTGNMNGSLTVRVLNNLTAPIDTAVCSVLVFVRGAENLEYANPRDIAKEYSVFGMQSGVEPIQTNTPFDDRYLVNWGEAIPSVRLLLRRSSLVDRIVAPAITSTDKAGILRSFQTRFPPMPGYDPAAYTAAKGKETPATTYPFSFTYLTYLGWFSTAFIAMRGSTRWHYNVVNPDGAIPHNISVTRRVATGFTSGNQGLEMSYVTGAASTATTQSLVKGAAWNAYQNFQGSSGIVLTNPNTQTGVSVELPMMTNYLFQFANPRNWLLGTSTDGSNVDNYVVDVNLHPSAGTGFDRLSLYRYVAAGTDFTLHFFLNTPVINYNANTGSVPA